MVALLGGKYNETVRLAVPETLQRSGAKRDHSGTVYSWVTPTALGCRACYFKMFEIKTRTFTFFFKLKGLK